jgi:curved DNA-binding protein CbpA
MQTKTQTDTKNAKSHYDALGIKQDASKKDIDEAYKKLST